MTLHVLAEQGGRCSRCGKPYKQYDDISLNNHGRPICHSCESKELDQSIYGDEEERE